MDHVKTPYKNANTISDPKNYYQHFNKQLNFNFTKTRPCEKNVENSAFLPKSYLENNTT